MIYSVIVFCYFNLSVRNWTSSLKSERSMKKSSATILVIDDREDILFSAKVLLKQHFDNVIISQNPRKFIDILSQNEVDVVLLDMNFKLGHQDGREGLYYLKEILTLSPSVQVILMTAYGNVESAVESLKQGAYDYVLKPWDNSVLIEKIKKAVLLSRQKKKKEIIPIFENKPFVGKAPNIIKAFTLAEKVATTDVNVLILGENGTGKSMLAQYIHENSNRKNNSFIQVDLGSLNENLFESELFGNAKGAFTDAYSEKMGKFEAAQDGTIFLDEIGNLPLHLQSKLLHVIQNKIVFRLGSVKPIPLNVRIICATNQNIKAMVQNHTFREDLYYRINTIEISLPSLRDRKEDIVEMAHYLLDKLLHKYDKESITFHLETLVKIKKYAWKGNIRELENRLERAVILCDNAVICEKDLDLDEFDNADLLQNNKALSDIEKNTILQVLNHNKYNISKSAEELGLSRGALYRRIQKYGINLLSE